MSMELIKPPAVQKGALIGVFAPSFPAHVVLREKYLLGLHNLQQLGFRIREGMLVKAERSQGYRSGTPEERATEFMQLIEDPEVACLMSVIGGMNSSSMIPYLDYALIRSHPKVICGYSDLTALQLAVLNRAGLRCFYGPAVVPSFGEPGNGFAYTNSHFLHGIGSTDTHPVQLQPPERWSNHFIDATLAGWQGVERIYHPHGGWHTLVAGTAQAPLLPVNLDTLLALAGTPYFPDLQGCILMLEEMDAPFDNLERNLSQLALMGVFDNIAGLIISKSENSQAKGAPFTEEALLMEFVGDASYPVVTQFDCGHTYPMLTLQQMVLVKITAAAGREPVIELLEPMVV